MDVHDFLAQPLVARVAAAGPSVRPVWFIWEEGSFWWLTGSYAKLGRMLEGDPRLALVVDTCEPAEGRVLSVTCTGTARVVPLDRARAVRKLTRYLGPQEGWPARFADPLDLPTTEMIRFTPDRPPRLRDMSW
ncbi:pyridoxamine 5'-phosphate oxidase family protein [Streptomyces sp. NPDC058646]|uniref:pyridoxamine 5'-phosphate oxidase family protein n=1 Tax=Streptomyces sp. NPDC058646 TaxID=3346574 RepID=UPI003647B2E0